MRNVVTLLIALTVFCGSVERSQAATYPWPNLVTNPVAAPELASDAASAMLYWKAHGLTLSDCHVQTWWVTTINVPNVIGLGGGCDVALRRTDFDGTPWTPLQQWNLMVHETGHILGLQHNDPRFPIMSPTPLLNTVPLSEKVAVPPVVKVAAPKKPKKAKKAAKRCNRKHRHKHKHRCKRRPKLLYL